MHRSGRIGAGQIAASAAFAVLHLLLSALSFATAWLAGSLAPFWWPAAGLTLGVLVCTPRDRWGWYLVPALLSPLLLGLLASSIHRELPAGLAILWSVGLVAPAPIGALLLRATADGRPFCLASGRQVALFLLLAVVVPSLAALGLLTLAWTVWPGVNPAFQPVGWFAAMAVGLLSTAPLVIATATFPREPVTRGRLLETGLLLLAIAITGWALGALSTVGLRVMALACATLPLLAWAAIRFGPAGASWTVALLAGLTIVPTLHDHGPFSGLGIVAAWKRVAFAEGYFALAMISGLLLAAVAVQRRQSTRRERVILESNLALFGAQPLSVRLDGVAHALARFLRGRGATSVGPDDVRALESVRDRIVGAVEKDRLRRELAFQAGRKDRAVALLDAVLRSAPLAISISDRQLRIVRANEAMAALVGTPAPALAGSGLGELLPAIGGAIEEREAKALVTGVAEVGFRLHGPVPGTGGEERDWLITTFPILAPGRSPYGIGVIAIDGTDRLQRERTLRRREERFRRLMEATSDLVWTTDARWRPKAGAEAWSAFTGQSEADFLAGRWMEMVHPDDRPAIEEATRKLERTGRSHGVRYRLRRSDGQYRVVEAHASALRDPDGSVVEWVGVARDVTERVLTEESRERALEQAQRAIRLRDDFLSIASHELRMPLRELAGRLQSMLLRLEAREPIGPDDFQAARAALDRLTFLINDLLDVGRIRESIRPIRPVAVPLSEVVREVASSYVDPADAHTLELDLPDEPLLISGDRARIVLVVDNLLDNAFRFSPGGGRIRISLRAHDGKALLSVSDEGIGIAPADRERIFERRVSLDGGGQGLGLSTTRDVVEAHGGQIRVENNEPHGTAFLVSLPLLAERGAEARRPAP